MLSLAVPPPDCLIFSVSVSELDNSFAAPLSLAAVMIESLLVVVFLLNSCHEDLLPPEWDSTCFASFLRAAVVTSEIIHHSLWMSSQGVSCSCGSSFFPLWLLIREWNLLLVAADVYSLSLLESCLMLVNHLVAATCFHLVAATYLCSCLAAARGI